VPRLLTKRTHIFPALIALLVFPAAALAAGDGGVDSSLLSDPNAPRPPLADARVAPLTALERPAVRFRRTLHVFAHRIRAERRAAAREHRRELYASLPAGVTLDTLNAIASCESGGDPTAVSSDGSYRGKYQFDYGTWESVGGHGDPAAAPEPEQDYRAALLYAQSGSSPWPVCG
jgi:soluble lytic murein transglycosylase-like protein